MKLTTDDIKAIVSFLNSDRVTIKGNEAYGFVSLVLKLQACLQATEGGDPVSTPPQGDVAL